MSIIMSDYEEENQILYSGDEKLMDRSYELNQSIDSMDY